MSRIYVIPMYCTVNVSKSGHRCAFCSKKMYAECMQEGGVGCCRACWQDNKKPAKTSAVEEVDTNEGINLSI